MNVLVALTFALISTAASPFDLEGNEIVPRGRISHGQTARRGQFPYMAGLLILRSNSQYFHCGGTLISNKWILTAAHCLSNLSYIEVHLGSLIFWETEISIVVQPQDTFVHESYNFGENPHDIALIKIPAINFTSNICAANLPPNENAVYTGRYAVIAGWGRTSSTSDLSPMLQWAYQRVITTKHCSPYYDSPLPKKTVCIAATGGISACNGDSGGPLVLQSERIVIGVASLSLCDEPYPTVFTSVAEHLPWINKTMSNN